MLLPLLHKITHEDVVKKYPLLAGIIIRSSEANIDSLAQEVFDIVKQK